MSLTGTKVLVTRPLNQSTVLCEQIVTAGGKPIAFPVIDIQFKTDELLTDWQAQQWNMIIFISRNSVAGFNHLVNIDAINQQTKLVAVGEGTAKAMQEVGLRVDVVPTQGGSEYLLALTAMQQLSGNNILIVRGQGGRELLAETLKERGANISYGEVYERVASSATLQQCQQAMKADVVICTSQVGVQNLVSLLAADKLALMEKPLIVLSEGIKAFASSLGFKDVIVTATTSDAAIFDRLMQMER